MVFMLPYLFDFMAGLGIGFIAGLLGVGGGFLIVPVLVFLGEPIHVAIGTSLACITLSSLASAHTHLRRGAVLFKVVVLKEAFSIPLAVAGAYVSTMIPERGLRVVFAALLLYLSYALAKNSSERHHVEEGDINYSRVPIVGVLSGFMSGLLGISGGILNVPLFHAYIGIPIRYAVGTSSLALFFTALAGTIGHYHLGQVDLETALLLAPGLVLGAYLGAVTAHRIHPSNLKRIFAVFLAVMAIKMLL